MNVFRLYALLFFLVPLASDAIRVVRQGGGYAEMQAVYVNEILQKIIEKCEINKSECALSQDQSNLIQDAIKSEVLLAFDPQCRGNLPILDEKKNLVLESCELYVTSEQKPKPFAEIAKHVLAARLLVFTNLDYVSALNLSTTFFQEFSQEELSYSVLYDSGEFRLHFMSVRGSSLNFDIFSVEGKKQALNLTEKLNLSIQKIHPKASVFKILEFNSFQELDPGKFRIDMQIEFYTQDRQKYRAQAQLYMQFDSSGDPMESTAQFNIFRIEQEN